MIKSRQQLNRREFLARAMATAAAVTLSQFLPGCTAAPTMAEEPAKQPSATIAIDTSASEESNPTSTSFQPIEATTRPPDPTGTNISPNTVEPTLEQPSVTPEPSVPDLVVARGGEPENLVRKALAALGGMEKFVPSGSSVLIKPNVCVAYHTYEYAATTNPWVVGTLVKMAFEAGAKTVKVMDFPFGGTPEESYAISGIEEQVKAAGGELITSLPDFKFIDTDIPDGRYLKSTKIFDDVLQADVVINVPVAKTHGLARLTLGMKNMLGVVRYRSEMHAGLGQKLVDITSRVKPALTVIDAVRMLMANGPTGGSLDDVKKSDTIIAGVDVVAADSYGATLFGMQPSDLEYIEKGVESGLGRSDLENLYIEEIAVE